MDISEVFLPAGIGVAAVCALAALGLVLRSRRSREQDKLSASERETLAKERRESWRRRLAVISLAVAFVIIFCIAGIAAWLSFGAQKAYAFDRNGGSWSAATGFALLLDAGALGLSLMRLFEALTARSSQLTRLYLVAFVVASATMNLLHAPHAVGESPSFGGRLVAVIPPLVYAIFLETLLKKIEQLVLGRYPKKKTKKSAERGYSLLLWVPLVGYPLQMWKKWREDLRGTIQYVRAPGSRKPLPAPPGPPQAAVLAAESPAPVAPPVARREGPAPAPADEPQHVPAPVVPAMSQESARPIPVFAAGAPPSAVSAPARPVSKKEQLYAALVEQIRQGDLRVLSENAQISNAAAYQANRRLGQETGLSGGLMRDGAVRTAVKQLLPDLRRMQDRIGQERAEASAHAQVNEPTPVHREASEDVLTWRRDGEASAAGIGKQRTAAEDSNTEHAMGPKEPSYA